MHTHTHTHIRAHTHTQRHIHSQTLMSSQECEGVMKPDTWGSVEDPFDAETDDEEAEEFNHM